MTPPGAPTHSAAQARFDAALRRIGTDDAQSERQAAVELEALANDPETRRDDLAPEALFEAGQLYDEHLGDPESARRCYRALLVRFPSSRLVRRAAQRLALLETALRSGAAPLVQFQQILRTTDGAQPARRDKLQALLVQHPDFALTDQALFLMGDTSLRLGDDAAAARHFATLHARYPRSVWSAHAHRAQAEADLRAHRIQSARGHYHALQPFTEAPWPIIESDGLRACNTAAMRLSIVWSSWLYLLGAGALCVLRARRRLLPVPADVWYYLPIATFLSLVAWWAQGGALALPIAALGGGGTAIAWLAAASARVLPTSAAGGRGPLLRGLVWRGLAVVALFLVVTYHFNLVDLVVETVRNGPDAE